MHSYYLKPLSLKHSSVKKNLSLSLSMGRPPCCEKVGIKKGPWTPEEDIILVSYIQEHGPGNWRSVPTNTGLSRCSKSCRLRWTNYLRPGIKRGNFTPHEEGMIIHLQALLGNKWAAIASYLPQRTDNDIKNYWNTHLKKKLKKFQAALDPSSSSNSTICHHQLSKSFSDTSLDITNNHASSLKLTHQNSSTSSSSSLYASSTENISRLLEGWMRTSPNNQPLIKGDNSNNNYQHHDDLNHEFENNNGKLLATNPCDLKNLEINNHHGHDQEFDSIVSCGPPPPPLSYLEKWLLDENVGHVDEIMELSDPIF